MSKNLEWYPFWYQQYSDGIFKSSSGDDCRGKVWCYFKVGTPCLVLVRLPYARPLHARLLDHSLKCSPYQDLRLLFYLQ